MRSRDDSFAGTAAAATPAMQSDERSPPRIDETSMPRGRQRCASSGRTVGAIRWHRRVLAKARRRAATKRPVARRRTFHFVDADDSDAHRRFIDARRRSFVTIHGGRQRAAPAAMKIDGSSVNAHRCRPRGIDVSPLHGEPFASSMPSAMRIDESSLHSDDSSSPRQRRLDFFHVRASMQRCRKRRCTSAKMNGFSRCVDARRRCVAVHRRAEVKILFR
jgi:hypothetical protein